MRESPENSLLFFCPNSLTPHPTTGITNLLPITAGQDEIPESEKSGDTIPIS
jgi:hypothetical protein